ncbi:MAG TPA: Xaa-Pro peptidase family protein [Clostridiaceae bacterium]
MIEKRIEAFRGLLKKNGIECALLTSDVNRNYMSGFTGNESYAIITADRAIFVTDSRYTEQAANQVANYEIIEYKGYFIDFFQDFIEKLNVKNIGFEDNYVPYNFYKSLSDRLKLDIIPLGDIVEGLRIIKDKEELSLIRHAASIADDAFDHMLSFIRAGMTEFQVGLELEFFMKKNGASALSFPSIVASGSRSSLPHGEATKKIINKGEFLTLDFGCVYEEYCSDMTRTLIIGEPDDKMIEIYETVLGAQKEALKFIKAGLTGAEVDKIARKYINDRGFGKYFGHGLGHGVGRLVHEGPYISFKGVEELKSGMVITDEPGIYIPSFGGVRIEDLLVVLDGGCEVFSKAPKDLIII